MKKLLENIIERLNKLKDYEKGGDCPKDGMCEGGKRCESCYSESAIDIVNEGFAEFKTFDQIEQDWIPVTDKLPKEYSYQYVWVTTIAAGRRMTRSARWELDRFNHSNGRPVQNVIAWKPYHVPAPYDPDESEVND